MFLVQLPHPRWPVVSCCQNRRGNPLLQRHNPHHQDHTSAGHAGAAGKGSCSLVSRLLQLYFPVCAIWPLQLIQSSAAQLAFTLPKFPTLLLPSPFCAGYRWLLESDLSHWFLPIVLQMAQAHSTSRTLSNHVFQPVHNGLTLPNGLLTAYF